MIVDAHIHVLPPEIIGDHKRIAEKEPWFAILCASRACRMFSAEQLVAEMDEDGVDQGWLCGFGFLDQGLCRLCNDYIDETARRWPGRFERLAVVSPLDPGAEREILSCAERGFIGVGEIFPDGQRIDISDMRQTWRLNASAHEAGMFLFFHTAEPLGRDYSGKGDTGPEEAMQFCVNHPEAKVLFAHWGGGLWLFESLLRMRSVLRNAWYDTAATPFIYETSIFDAAFAAGVGHKILFGSDAPILRVGRYHDMLARTALSSAQKEALLGGNHKRFLNFLKECD